jgi:chromosome segregation ATPase
LREAHRARADATAEVERLHSAVDRAQAHVVEVTAHRDGLQHDIEVDEAADTERLIRELAAGTAGRVEPAAGEKRVALAEAAHQVSVAQRAADKISSDLAAAQQRLSTAETKVSSAVSAMLLNVAQAEAEAILQAADDLDSRRADLDALGVVITAQQRRTGAGRQPWPASIITALQPELRGSPRLPSKFATPAGAEMGRRWSAIAAALLADPDAPLAEGES